MARILLYPQYWSWRLSGVQAAEVTSLGTHTDLWRPYEQAYSALARKQGWARLMPTLHRATDQLGTHARAALSPPPDCRNPAWWPAAFTIPTPPTCASCMDREREAFTVVSSGTWTIVMANRGELRRLREERDMLANVNVFGAPIATARYMGGREYEAIAQGSRRADHRRADRSAHQRRDRAAFVCQRRARIRAGRESSMAPTGSTALQRAALATLYSALMTAQLIESLGTAGEIFIDGPLARNPLFGGLLGACVPVGTVRTYPEGGGTRVAAHLAGLPSPQPGVLRNVVPLRIAGPARIPGQLAPSSRGTSMKKPHG